MITPTLSAFVFLAAVLLASCQAADDARPAATITGRTWTLTALNGKPLALAANQRVPTLELQGDTPRVAAFGGVNRLNGTYTLAGQALSIGALVATRMAGSQEAMATEATFSRVLGGVQGWSVVDGQLELTGTAGTARFAAPAP